MNHQPANTYPDARIDQVLDALRTTEPPSGLEQRIAARLAQAAEARTLNTEDRVATPPFLAVILNAVKDPCISLAPAKFYSAAAFTVVLALTTLTLLHNRTPTTTAQTIPTSHPQSGVPHLRDGIIVAKVGHPVDAVSPTTQVSQAFSLGSHNPLEAAPVPLSPSAQDPEAIALAETLAPSRAPPPQAPPPQPSRPADAPHRAGEAHPSRYPPRPTHPASRARPRPRPHPPRRRRSPRTRKRRELCQKPSRPLRRSRRAPTHYRLSTAGSPHFSLGRANLQPLQLKLNERSFTQ
jgi:hypothetical protein